MRRAIGFSVVVLVLALVSTAGATPTLPVGLAGGTLVASATQSVTSTTFTASVFEWVVQDSGTGFLDFAWQVVVNTGHVGQITIYPFLNAYGSTVGDGACGSGDLNCATLFPSSDGVSPNSETWAFDELTYTWTGKVGNPTANAVCSTNCSSDILYALTTAPAYGGAVLTLQDGSVTETVSFAPVPEPTSLLLMGSGMVGLAGFLRRRFNIA